MSTIVRLEASNVKRLKAVQIDASGESVVVIGGANGAGKSSTLDCIQMALGGASKIPAQPIRKGERAARIVLETEDLIIERKFTPSGTTLEVRGKDGVKLPSPQAVLDRLCTSIAFDPLEFVRLGTSAEGRRKQAAKLVELAGLNLGQFDTRKSQLLARRTQAKANRDAHAAYAGGGGSEIGPKKDEAAAMAAVEAARTERTKLIVAKQASESAAKRQEELLAEIEGLREQIRRKQDQYNDLTEQLDVVDDPAVFDQADAAVKSAETKLTEVRQWNAKVAQFEAEKKYRVAYAAAEKELNDVEQALEELAETRTKTIAAAKFPVKGLGLSEDGNPTFNGIPLEQCSSAENIRIGVAMAIAASPGMPVMLIRDGSLLDYASLNLVGEMAAEAGAQVWIERVGEGSECTVIIEDGEVKP